MVLRELQKSLHIWAGPIRCFSACSLGRECCSVGRDSLRPWWPRHWKRSQESTTPLFLPRSASPVDLFAFEIPLGSLSSPGCFSHFLLCNFLCIFSCFFFFFCKYPDSVPPSPGFSSIGSFFLLWEGRWKPSTALAPVMWSHRVLHPGQAATLSCALGGGGAATLDCRLHGLHHVPSKDTLCFSLWLGSYL